MFGEIVSFLSLFDRVSKLFKRRDKQEQKKEPELVSTRFVRAFEAHGVHRNQIPRVIGHGLTLYDMKTDDSLLQKLNDEILDDACDLLGIRRAWLDGAVEEIYETYDFYKNPRGFKQFLLEKNVVNNENFSGVLLSPKKENNRATAVIIIQEIVGYIEGRPYYKYYICNNWSYTYWKAHAFLVCCISLCWKNKIYLKGKVVANELIDSIEYGLALLDWGSEGFYSVSGYWWHADDMFLNPATYLKSIDPERNNYGICSALSLWLELYDEGMIDFEYCTDEVREIFAQELERQLAKK